MPVERGFPGLARCNWDVEGSF